MNISSRSGSTDREHRDGSSSSRASDTGGRDYSGGFVGHKDRALGNAPAQPGTVHATHDGGADADEVPIGSALAAHGGGLAAGSDQDLSSGPMTLGATSGGERAVAGRADANRNSRDHGNSLSQ